MNAKNKILLLGLMAMAMSSNSATGGQFMEENKDLTPEEIERIKQRYTEYQKQLLLKKGLKEFTIEGITVIALNEKNAKRKIFRILTK